MTLALSEHYQVTLNSAQHWWLLSLALIGLVLTWTLIYRRFYRLQVPRSKRWSKLHCALLMLGNGLFFSSVLLYVLPVQVKLQPTAFDILLTPSLTSDGATGAIELADISAPQVSQALHLADRIWWLAPELKTAQWQHAMPKALSRYQHKIIKVRSVTELTRLWRTANEGAWPVFGAKYTAPRQLKIWGDGLTEQQWQPLRLFQQQQQTQNSAVITFEYVASQLQTGLVALHWQRQLNLGQALTVTGRLQRAVNESKHYRLSLVHHDQVLDSAILTNHETFSLTTTSKVTGLFSYQLQLSAITNKASNVTEAVSEQPARLFETIAVSVVKAQPVRVLVKQSAPSFETRKLKQWLSQTGNQIHVISQISEQQWAQQLLNPINAAHYASVSDTVGGNKKQAQATADHRLSASLLANNDLLIIDSRALLALSAPEVSALYHAITQGLGLLIWADASLLGKKSQASHKDMTKLLNLFTLSSADSTLASVNVTWPKQPPLGDAQTLSAQAAIALIANSAQSLVMANSGQALVVKQTLGLGVVAMSSLQQSYQWALQTSPAIYSHYWQYLLSHLLRNNNHTKWLLPLPAELSLAKQFHNICLLSPQAQVYSPQVSLSSYPLSGMKKCGRFRAPTKGWLEFHALAEDQRLLASQARYFYDDADFRVWQQARKQGASRKYSSNKALANKALVKRHSYQAVDKRYLWLIMLTLLLLLWLERKWYAGP
ncbi:hypothetical protein SAMN05216262_10875 [Colwellia chukchiensis]|uniref:Uncharacterized protein n=1 Tax=Colwellia chukchiensis TaxID=641665 RepID=A0A1H7NSA9_9GAMM|nr:hypothetical protein [Colwellia chukchiensis]SEL26423.1 hypothetical protein SAMN05216262_10875 [Colwellia chukchiensis]